MKKSKFNLNQILLLAVVLAVAVLAGCQLQAAEKATLTVSAAAQFGARGFYGVLNDVDKIDVYIYADPNNSGESADPTLSTGGAGTSSDNLVAKITINSGNSWAAEIPDVPTMTDLRIEAYAYGDSSVHSYDAIGWNVSVAANSDDADALGITMFTGTTSKYISSSTATIYLVMRPYNDGSLQRLPRIAGMTSNLNKAELRVDFNDYGTVVWPDKSSYEKWFWRIIESDGTVATTSFSFEDGAPESFIQFDADNTQDGQTADHDIVLKYLFPDNNDDSVVEWYKRVYWLEIANPQHNVLRQAFVMNPGADTHFDVNFAPWIRNITAGRYDESFDGDSSQVRWEADVRDDDTSKDVRYLWLLKLNDYWAVYGDMKSGALSSDSAHANYAEWVTAVSALLDNKPDLQQRKALSQELAHVLAPLDSEGNNLANGIGVDSESSFPDAGRAPSILTTKGGRFDDSGLSGKLYLLVFDGKFENGGTNDDNINGYDDYSWSYVKMELDSNSFPSVNGGGLIVFE